MSDNQEGREGDTEIGEGSLPHPETGDVAESGPSREESDSKKAIRAEPNLPTSGVPTTSQSGSGEPGGT